MPILNYNPHSMAVFTAKFTPEQRESQLKILFDPKILKMQIALVQQKEKKQKEEKERKRKEKISKRKEKIRKHIKKMEQEKKKRKLHKLRKSKNG